MLKLLLVLTFVATLGLTKCSKVNINVLMPNVAPKTKDSYLCTQIDLDEKEPVYITNFTPKSVKEVAHHMLLYSCDEDMGSQVWNCGEMASHDENSLYKSGPVCNGKSSIIYAWAMDAPKLDLPNDVSFKLGGNTNKKKLVLQVHYANVDKFINGDTDNSGVILNGQTESTPNTAGVYILLDGLGYVDPGQKVAFDSACVMSEKQTIYPFAYRTHTHKLGIVNSGYIVRKDPVTGEQEWIEIGRRSPQLPQMFFPIADKTMEIRQGDMLAARCTMKNFRNTRVSMGPTGNDEMCNFYVMYYVKGDQPLEENICAKMGAPYWQFEQERQLDISKIPNNIGEVPVNQLKELSEMENHASMNEMNSHGKVKEEAKPVKVDEMVNDLEHADSISQNDELNNEVDYSDVDYSDYDQLQKYIMKKYYNLRK